MDSEPPKPAKLCRRWYVRHLPTCVVLLIVVGALAAINTRNSLNGWRYTPVVVWGPDVSSLYGWPEVCVSRTAEIPFRIGPWPGPTAKPPGSYSIYIWPLL